MQTPPSPYAATNAAANANDGASQAPGPYAAQNAALARGVMNPNAGNGAANQQPQGPQANGYAYNNGNLTQGQIKSLTPQQRGQLSIASMWNPGAGQSVPQYMQQMAANGIPPAMAQAMIGGAIAPYFGFNNTAQTYG